MNNSKVNTWLKGIVIAGAMASVAETASAFELNIGKALGLKSAGVGAQIGEMIGYGTGKPGVAASFIAADNGYGELKKALPVLQKLENSVMNSSQNRSQSRSRQVSHTAHRGNTTQYRAPQAPTSNRCVGWHPNVGQVTSVIYSQPLGTACRVVNRFSGEWVWGTAQYIW